MISSNQKVFRVLLSSQIVRALRTLLGLNGLDHPEVPTYAPDHGVQGPVSPQQWTFSSGLIYTVGVLFSSSATAMDLPGHMGPQLVRLLLRVLEVLGAQHRLLRRSSEQLSQDRRPLHAVPIHKKFWYLLLCAFVAN